MKNIFFLALLCFAKNLAAQNALMDAWSLRDAFVKTDKEGEYRMVWKDSARMAAYVNILMKYNATDIQTTNQLEKVFEANPILLIEKVPQSAFRFDPGAGLEMMGKVVPGAPGLGLASAADGLAKFLVKRTKEELTLSFFSQFQKWLEQNREFGTLFPTTFFLMVDVNSDVFDFNHYLDGLRSAFIKDMKVLPTNLQNFVRVQKKADGRALALAMDDLLSIGQAFVDERRPYQVFQFLASSDAAIQQAFRVDSIKNEDERRQVRDLAGGLRLTNILSESLRNTSGQTMWTDQRTALNMLNDERVRHIFLGLIWQQSNGLDFSNGFNFQKEIEGFAGKMNRFEPFMGQIRAFLSAADETERSLGAISFRTGAMAEKGIAYDELDRYFTAFTRLMEVGFRVYLKKEKPDGAQELNVRFVRSMRWVKELYFDARQSNYTSAVADASFLLTEIYGQNWPQRRSFLRYGNFMATVSEARTSDEMASAIESFAYPPGSSRLKKHSNFSVGLNAYPGLGLRGDLFDGTTEGSFYVPASLGFAVNKGLKKNWGSLSFYAPVIDVGALFAFRFKDISTSIAPQIKWENIVAPGGYLVYGLGHDLPLALGVGGQFSPSLKKVFPDGTVEIDGRRRFRPNLFLTVDIPVTHFYTR